MSVKAMSLVWDMECPAFLNGKEFKTSHKFLLLSYADHADFAGRNIWPAVGTMARKTGMDDRTVQRLTADLSEMGLLLDDGHGPKGTNKWALPFNAGGDKLSPLTNRRGDKNSESLGDNPSGDNPSGDKLSPELKEPKPINNILADKTVTAEIQAAWMSVLSTIEKETARSMFETWIKDAAPIHFEDGLLQVGVRDNAVREWMESRLQSSIERLLIGALGHVVKVEFVV